MLPGKWTDELKKAIEGCLITHQSKLNPTGKDISEYAEKLYGSLSSDIHGTPWSTNAVQLSSDLSPMDRCVMLGLFKEMGIVD